jgi:hypothetical protein
VVWRGHFQLDGEDEPAACASASPLEARLKSEMA